MKRSDLKVGDEVYYSRHRDWAVGVGPAAKAVVVDVGCWRSPDTWSRDRAPRTGGTGVLCDVQHQYGTHREAVPLSHLRGPWAETLVAVEAAERNRRARENAKRTAEGEAVAAAQHAVGRAHRLGLTGVSASGWGEPITVSLPDLLALLDAYEERAQ